MRTVYPNNFYIKISKIIFIEIVVYYLALFTFIAIKIYEEKKTYACTLSFFKIL
jgi:hypothetical protein